MPIDLETVVPFIILTIAIGAIMFLVIAAVCAILDPLLDLWIEYEISRWKRYIKDDPLVIPVLWSDVDEFRRWMDTHGVEGKVGPPLFFDERSIVPFSLQIR